MLLLADGGGHGHSHGGGHSHGHSHGGDGGGVGARAAFQHALGDCLNAAAVVAAGAVAWWAGEVCRSMTWHIYGSGLSSQLTSLFGHSRGVGERGVVSR